MKDVVAAELEPRPRSLLIAAAMIAASVTYLSLHMAEAVVDFRKMFKDLGLTPSATAEWVFSAPRIWWLFALASVAVLAWVASKPQLTAAAKRQMKTAMWVTVLLTALTYGVTAFAIYRPLFALGAKV